ncbi:MULTISPECIES: TetR/AcrR family transcriptional regulator [Lactobacillus]|uniref:TetR/AcrR family transcriptional regulator n=1 Tax=Lactobacillus xujianguonis TaxID=2495899 RepID=A0A437SU94_9LACO|nr:MULTISPECIES: TetR/AcrR family transcriptional regulator [Lactobacillus]RVU70442.1 TetR/AcrR family transcriptional regulator [Lactobacillus xujianguonis]RVU73286.1 TetR/AcrR family transcriptional regulator [Lactobacillus xujianguonis]
MVKSTFINLPDAKKQRVTAALLAEFSNHALTDAQVAQIVKDANIARGAFYKYFDDLTDAYTYLYQIAIQDIHVTMQPDAKFDPDFFYERVLNFLDEAGHSKYKKMMRLHMLYNEAAIPGSMKTNSEQLLKMTPEIWSAMVLSHEVIVSVFADPDNKAENLKRYKESLYLIKRGANK